MRSMEERWTVQPSILSSLATVSPIGLGWWGVLIVLNGVIENTWLQKLQLSSSFPISEEQLYKSNFCYYSRGIGKLSKHENIRWVQLLMMRLSYGKKYLKSDQDCAHLILFSLFLLHSLQLFPLTYWICSFVTCLGVPFFSLNTLSIYPIGWNENEGNPLSNKASFDVSDEEVVGVSDSMSKSKYLKTLYLRVPLSQLNYVNFLN